MTNEVLAQEPDIIEVLAKIEKRTQPLKWLWLLALSLLTAGVWGGKQWEQLTGRLSVLEQRGSPSLELHIEADRQRDAQTAQWRLDGAKIQERIVARQDAYDVRLANDEAQWRVKR